VSDHTPNATTPREGRERRRTPPSAHGEPAVWLTGSALVACLALVAVTVMIIASEGFATLWPRPIERVTLRSGEVFLGLPMGSESYQPGERELVRVGELVSAGEIDPLAGGGPQIRYRFRLGNRDIGRDPFVWVPSHEIVSRDRPDEAVLVERDEWGVFIGVPTGMVVRAQSVEPADEPFVAEMSVETPHGIGTATRSIENEDGRTRTVREIVRIADGPAETLAAFERLRGEFSTRRARIERLQRKEIPAVQDRLSAVGWRVGRAQRRGGEPATGAPWAAWLGAIAGVVVLGAGAARLVRVEHASVPLAGLRLLCVGGALACALFVVLERPIARSHLTADRVAAVEAAAEAERAELTNERDALLAEVRMLERMDGTVRLEITDAGLGRFAPESQSRSELPMRLSQATRIVESNRLGFWSRIGVYLSRWADFLSKAPGESPGDGGVFPVIVGTVVLTLLLTVTVVPLGVIAAIYLREYASQGLVTSVIRIAINNLAGVPSIVYGMFGLGFFCYTMGGYIDSGPGEAAMGAPPWWGLLATLVLVLVLAGALSAVGSDRGPVRDGSGLGRTLAKGTAWWAWLSCVCLAGYLLWTTPYFGGFFAEKLPEQPTFGTRGILWAALTLALLTLPVVIVATEEAIARCRGRCARAAWGAGRAGGRRSAGSCSRPRCRVC
jgi:ABC-type phosphate transport system permease subunit